MKKILAVAAAALAAVTFAGCGADNFKDVKNVGNAVPDYIRNYENMDGHPNVGMLCIHGAGFATTTRSYSAILRVPEWDAFCRSVAK